AKPPAVGRRVGPEGQGHRRHEQGGEEGEGPGDGEPAQDEAPDGDVVLDRVAEVTAEGAAEPLPVLDGERPVEPHRPAEDRRGLRAGLSPQDEEGGVARDDPHDHEDDEGDGEERPAQGRQATEDETPHGRRGLSGRPLSAEAYFAQETSARSIDGVGRSFQIPWTPFLAATSRG